MCREPPIGHLYVHVPFCARKCPYCAFFSEPAKGEIIGRYVRCLLREMSSVAAELEPETIFFGGGTPSLLNLRQWELLLRTMSGFGWRRAAEWTVECNPATVSLDKARLLREGGVNRISIGAQSFDAALLARLGRVHSRAMIFKSFDILRAAGFDNINMDLMFGIPGQTLDSWRRSLAEAVSLGCEHLSCYELTYEEDTPFLEQLQAGGGRVDEDLACAMYDELLRAAAEAGFRQYEVSNFARHSGPAAAAAPDRACRHNINYWRGGSFYGLGPSASGYVRGIRTRNWSNTPLYCRLVEGGRSPVESSEQLPPLARAGEIAAFGLRMTSGWPLAAFRRRTGFDLAREWKPEIGRMVDMGYGKLTRHSFRLTKKGLRFADWVGSEFLRS